MKKLIYVSVILFALLIPKSFSQLTVGVSPQILDLGEIEPGISKIARFYLVTSSKEKFFVYMKSTRDDIRTFTNDKYKDHINNYSEEDTNSWIEFLNNPVELQETVEKKTTKAGVPITGAREIIFILNVPENAEPGYHSGRIDLNPTSFGGSPSMLSIKAVVPLIYVFRVPGRAIREGKILDVSSGDYGTDGRLNLKIYFQNTGTVTLKTIGSAQIFDNRGILDSLSTNLDFVEPGKTVVFSGFWFPGNLKIGKYNATAELDYTTGLATKKSFIEVYERPVMPVAKVVEEEFIFPWWTMILIFIVIIIIAIYLYYKN